MKQDLSNHRAISRKEHKSGEKRPPKSLRNTVLVGPTVDQVGERRTANQVTSLASRIYVGPVSSVGERRGASVARNKRKKDETKGGSCSPAQCEPLLSGTSARCRVQVVSCSSSTFLDAIEPFRPIQHDSSVFNVNPRDIQTYIPYTANIE